MNRFTVKPIYVLNLALQGGGAHGAFTWGVLDRLLAETDIGYGTITGTSAGALNAVALAAGFARGGHEAARGTLAALWDAVTQVAEPDFMKFNPFFASFSRAAALATFGGAFAPNELNPLGFNPLKRILEEHIDFDALRRPTAPDVRVTATEVETGLARHFSGSSVTLDAVLASACLPMVQAAVMIDDIPYWDGGFSANPDLMGPILDGRSEDTLIVEINPLFRPGVPKTARDIADQVNHITFNAPYLRDLSLINALRDLPDGLERSQLSRLLLKRFVAKDKGLAAQAKRHRFHLISAGDATATLDVKTKAAPDQALIASLKAQGFKAASRWLRLHKDSIGNTETIDLTAHLAKAEKARMP